MATSSQHMCAGSPPEAHSRAASTSGADDSASSRRKPANPLSYPKSSQPYDERLFKSPTAEYRGCPLWAWNTKLEKKELLRQIDHFHDMGLGGFHMHVRTGLDTEYMGTEFMDCVRACVDYAEEKGMLACLYDDDRWPSGSAGGSVTKQYPEHRTKHLLFTTHPYGTIDLGGDCSPSSAAACRSENGYLLARYAVSLDGDGFLGHYKRLKQDESAPEGARIWYAYLESNPPSQWFNNETYIDTMSKKAMQRFIESTHEVYKAKVGDKFGSTVPCIFTDEPQFATKSQLSNPEALDDLFLPWTADLPDTFRQSYGYGEDLLDGLPEVVFAMPKSKPSLVRYRFHDHVCERFVSAFMDQLGSWCRSNGIMLNGHMMEEPTLRQQTSAVGEVMRCYRNQTLPGIDLLNDWVEYNTAKQASSVARQRGVKGTMSEIYGCTHWTFTFEGHKGCGDWQAALGITFRVQHLAWLSMKGEGKRDYPASINYQSPWSKEYGYVEDHFARVGVAMTRGHAVTHVAVVHPIESFWMAYGPHGVGDEMRSRDDAFGNLTNWLLHGLVDFDFLCESILPGQFRGVEDQQLLVGACKYDVVILPNLRTIRSTTLKILVAFVQRGGKVIIAGSTASMVNGDKALGYPVKDVLRSLGQKVSWDKDFIIDSLEEYRELRITREEDGTPADKLLYQMRQDGDSRFVFICNTDRNYPVDTVVELKGLWDVTHMDTLTGDSHRRRDARRRNDGWTSFNYRFEGCGSLLLRLTPVDEDEDEVTLGDEEDVTIVVQQPNTTQQNLSVQLDEVILSEPNVLMLDYASYSVDGGVWAAPTEILRIDNEIRDKLQIHRKGMAWRQPWTVPEKDRGARAKVALWFTFYSDVDVDEETQLALEDPNTMAVYVNFREVQVPSPAPPPRAPPDESGWWVDRDIRTLPIPPGTIRKGINYVHAYFPFGLLTNIERLYILGKFKVGVVGHMPTLRSWNDSSPLTFGDITEQGLPFYVGNVTYKCSFFTSPRADVKLWVPHFSSPVLTVTGSHKPNAKDRIAFQPRQLDLGTLDAGPHRVEITAYGNRYNAFGHVHVPPGVGGCWPDRWRTQGGEWTDDYALKPVGILECPEVLITVGADTDDDQPQSPGWVLVSRRGQNSAHK